MTPETQAQFPPISVRLKDGRTVEVRPLHSADAPALAAFYASVPREDLRFYYPHPLTAGKAAENAAAAQSPTQVVLVLETDQRQIVGYAWYRWRTPDDPASSFGICIRRDYQDSGAGRAIMKRLLEIARVAGPPTVTLTVQKANARAFNLYRAMGFRVVREQMRPERAEMGMAAEPEYAMERVAR